MKTPPHPRMASGILATALFSAAAASPSVQDPGPEAILDLMREAEARLQARDWSGAEKRMERVVELNPHLADAWYRLGRLRSITDAHREAIPAFERALALGAGSQMSSVAYDIAREHGLLGEKEPALAWLEGALDGGLRGRDRIGADGAFASLRDDPRFAALTLDADTAGMSRAEGWRHDLALLESEVARMHCDPFRRIPRTEFAAELRRLEGDVDGLTDDQVIVRVMALLSRIGDGHTGCFPDLVPSWNRTLPVQFELFREGLFVVSAEPAGGELVGAQVLRIGEHAAEHVIDEFDRIVSRDNAQGILRGAPQYLRYPQILSALGLQSETDRVRMTIRGADGEQRSVTVAAAPNDPEFDRITGHPRWAAAYDRSPEPMPLYLRDRRTPYWFELLPDEKTVYFQLNVVTSVPEPLDRFVERLFAFIDEHQVERLVIDMRWANGGNTLLLPPLVRALCQERSVTRRGHLFVIVGRYTYSAAMNAAAYIEHHTEAIFVGEPTPSSPNWTGESNMVRLPWSRIHVSISDIFWQSASPLDHRTWIAPAIYVPPSFEAYASKRDPALEAILAVRTGD